MECVGISIGAIVIALSPFSLHWHIPSNCQKRQTKKYYCKLKARTTDTFLTPKGICKMNLAISDTCLGILENALIVHTSGSLKQLKLKMKPDILI